MPDYSGSQSMPGGTVYGNPTTGVTTQNPGQDASTAATPEIGPGFTLKTQGWYITAAVVVSVALANTPAGPWLFGLLSVALIYQVDQLLQGK